MSVAKERRPAPRDQFEKRIGHQFGLSPAFLRAIGELHYPKGS
jgi:hypothetical protein